MWKGSVTRDEILRTQNVADLQRMCVDLVSRCEDLMLEVDASRNQGSAFQEMINQLLTEKETTMKKMEELESKNNNAGDITALQNLVDSLLKEKEEYELRINEQKKLTMEISEEMMKVKGELEETRLQLQVREKLLTEFVDGTDKQEVEDLKTKLNDSELENNSLTSMISALKQQIVDMSANDRSADIEALETKLRETELENERLVTQMEMNKKRGETKLTGKVEQIVKEKEDEIQTMIAAFEEDRKSLEEVIAGLKAQLQDAKEENQTLLTACEEDRAGYEEKLAELKLRNDELAARNEVLSKSYETELIRTKEELSNESSRTKEDLLAKNEELIREVENLRKELEAGREANQKITSVFEEEKREYERRLEEMTVKFSEVSSENERLSTENTTLSASNSELIRTKEELSNESSRTKEDLLAKNEELIREVENLRTLTRDLQTELDCVKSEFEKTNEQLQTAVASQAKLSSVQEMSDLLAAESKQMEQSLKARITELESTCAVLEEKNREVSLMRDQVDGMKNTEQSLRDKILELEKSNAEQESRMSSLAQELEEEKDKNLRLKSSLSDQETTASAEKDALQVSLTTQQEEIESLKMALSVSEQGQSALKEQNENLNRAVVEHTSKVQELESLLATQKEEYLGKCSELSEALLSVEDIQKSLIELQNERDVSNGECEKLRIEIVQLKENILQTTNEKEALTTALNEYNLEKERIQARSSELEAQTNSLQTTVEEQNLRIQELEEKEAISLSEAAQLKEENTRLKNLVQTEEASHNDKLQQLEAAQVNLKEAKDERSREAEEYNRKEAELQQEVSTLKQEIEKERAEKAGIIQDLKKELDEKNSELVSLQNSLEEKQHSFDTNSIEQMTQITQLNEKIEAMSSRLSELSDIETNLASSTVEVEELKLQISTLEERNKQISLEKEASAELGATLRQEYENLLSQKSAVDEQIVKITNEHAAEKESLIQEFDEVKAALKEKDENLAAASQQIETLKESVETVTKELHDLKNRNQDLEGQLVVTEEKLSVFEQEKKIDFEKYNEQLVENERLGSENERLKSIETELLESKNKVNELSMSITKLSEENEVLRENVDANRDKTQQEVSELTLAVSQKEEELNEARTAITKLETENEQKSGIIQETNSKLEALQTAQSELRAERDELNEALSTAMTELDIARESLDQFRQDNADLEAKLESFELSQNEIAGLTARLNSKCEELTSVTDQFNSLSKIHDDTCSSFQTRVKELESEVLTLKDLCDSRLAELATEKESVAALSSQVTLQEARTKELEDELAALQSQFQEALAHHQILNANLSEKTHECELLNQQHLEIESQLHQVNAENAELKLTIQNLRDEKAVSLEQSNTHLGQVTELSASLTEKQKLCDDLASSKQALETKVEELAAANASIANELAELNNLIQERDKTINHQESTLSSERKEKELLSQELEAANQATRELASEIEEKNEKLNKLTQELTSSEEERTELENIKNELQRQLHDQEENTKSLVKSTDEELMKLQQKVDELEKTNAALNTEILEKSASIGTLFETKSRLEYELSAHLRKHSIDLTTNSVVVAHIETKIPMEAENVELRRINEQLQRQIDDTTEKIAKLKAKIKSKSELEEKTKLPGTTRCSQLNQQVLSLLEQLEALSNDPAKICISPDELEICEQDQLDIDTENARLSLEVLTSEKQNLVSENELLAARIAEAESKEGELTHEIETLKNELAKVQSERDFLNEKLKQTSEKDETIARLNLLLERATKLAKGEEQERSCDAAPIPETQSDGELELKNQKLSQMLEKSHALYAELSEKYERLKSPAPVSLTLCGQPELFVPPSVSKSEVESEPEMADGPKESPKKEESTLMNAYLKRTLLQFFLQDEAKRDPMIPMILELVGCNEQQIATAQRQWTRSKQFFKPGFFGWGK